MATNRKILIKGIQYLSGALPLSFIAPFIIYNAFSNKNHPFYWIVLALGLILFFLAIYLIFKGVNTIVKSLFDEDKH